jgi:hypothetical protein
MQEKAMTSPKRDAPNHVANRKKSRETVPTSIQQSGGLTGDNAGIAQGRKTEDDVSRKVVDQDDGWNSNT